MSTIKKKLRPLFLWSWIFTLPLTLVGSYLTYQAWNHYETFAVRYDPEPATITLSHNFVYVTKVLLLKMQAAFQRYDNNWTKIEPIYLFASQADLSGLDANLPHSGFKFIKAGIMQDQSLIKAKIRYRGDFFSHWGREKKSIRVKTSKGQLYQGMRTFNLMAPKFIEQLNNYFSYRLATQLELITPQTKLVRVFLNNEDRGVHILVEQLNEMTLRKHKLMPADIYRGEMVGKDKYTDAMIDTLFQSDSVWDKVSVNNHYPPDSKKPLATLLQLIEDQDKPEAQAELSRVLDIEAWARFSIYEALIQSWHFDIVHNWRIFYDPWRQKFVPIVWDPVGWRWLLKQGALNEISITTLHKALFKNGDFLRQRYQLMQDFFTSGESEEFLEFVAETRQIMNFEVQSDPILNSPNVKIVRSFMQDLVNSIDHVFTALKNDSLAASQPVLYQYQSGKLQFYLQDQRPLKRIRLDFSQALNNQPKALLHFQQQKNFISKDISAGIRKKNYQLVVNLDLLPNFNSHLKHFKFFTNVMDRPLLGDYKLELSGLDKKASFIQLWADYGQGWVKTQAVTDKEIAIKDIQYMDDLSSTLTPYQDITTPWQLFWNQGQGFSEGNSFIVTNALDKTGVWRYRGLVPNHITELKVNLPDKAALKISTLTLRIGNESYNIPVQALKLQNMEIRNNSVISEGGRSPFFIIDMTPYAVENNKDIAELSFKVRQNVSWKQSLQLNEFPFHYDTYAPLPQQMSSDPVIWSGEMIINDVRTITRPLIIQPGTRVLFAENAALIIKNRLIAIGTKEKPIKFLPQSDSQKPWGTLVLFGSEANDSVINHCEFAEGSGLKADLFEYSAMLSIHNVQGVYISNCEFRDNHLVDDMVHAVYSDVQFKNNTFKRSFSDALDIDISRAVINDNQFIDSGNDAIDLMTTQAIVVDSFFKKNGDKAISVGEDSHLFALNNQMVENKIAVQAKDQSTALLFNHTFTDNETALHAYKKNWRYGSGGMILAEKSRFIGNQYDVQAKKHSHIYLFDSFITTHIDEKRVKTWNIDKTNPSQAQQGKAPPSLRSITEVKQAIDRIAPAWIEQINSKRRGATIDTP